MRPNRRRQCMTVAATMGGLLPILQMTKEGSDDIPR